MHPYPILSQGVAKWRLGPLNLFDKTRPSGHYVLDTSNPAHEQVRDEGRGPTGPALVTLLLKQIRAVTNLLLKRG